MKSMSEIDQMILRADGEVFLQCMTLLEMDINSATTFEIPAAIQRLLDERDAWKARAEAAEHAWERLREILKGGGE